MCIRTLLKEKKLMRRFASMLAVAVICIVAVTSFFLMKDSSLAWLFENPNVQGNGVRVQTGTEQLRFEPVITVLPSVGDTAYEPVRYIRHADGGYYRVAAAADAEEGDPEAAGEYDGVSYVFEKDSQGNRIPIQLTGLFPGETLTVTVGFRCVGEGSMRYQLSLADFDDTDGRFTIAEGNGNTPGEYSILGIFRAELVDVVPESGNDDHTVGQDSGSYFASYDTENGKSVLGSDPFVLAEGTASPENGVITCTFRISVQLGDPDAGTQYYALRGTVANQLSKKRFSIGSLRLSEILGGEAGS